MAEEKKPAKAKPAVTKEMNIAEIAMKHPETIPVFMKYGMHCLGCVAARFENLEQGAAAHGIDPDKMVVDLNAAVEEKKKEKK
ncbi:DUF1858 domain-containing protein [Candidatus Woesearchaeota archaeon]|nr:DUF1858 domain-containing protein [Candidatus Woesearchaeota archaeon]